MKADLVRKKVIQQEAIGLEAAWPGSFARAEVLRVPALDVVRTGRAGRATRAWMAAVGVLGVFGALVLGLLA